MTITRDEFDDIKYRYSGLLLTDSDAVDAFRFVHEVLCAEVDALKERCSYATKTIERYEHAAYEVFCLSADIEQETFDER